MPTPREALRRLRTPCAGGLSNTLSDIHGDRQDLTGDGSPVGNSLCENGNITWSNEVAQTDLFEVSSWKWKSDKSGLTLVPRPQKTQKSSSSRRLFPWSCRFYVGIPQSRCVKCISWTKPAMMRNLPRHCPACNGNCLLAPLPPTSILLQIAAANVSWNKTQLTLGPGPFRSIQGIISIHGCFWWNVSNPLEILMLSTKPC